MYKKIKIVIYNKLVVHLLSFWTFLKWQVYKKKHSTIKIVLGAGPTKYPGWFSTNIYSVDVTNEKNFEKYFSYARIDKVLAEHVLEHLTELQIRLMIENLLKYSNDTLTVRIAVPDGFHADPEYIETVKPGGSGYGSDDHKHLFNYQSLSKIFSSYGFTYDLIEYWDEQRQFHQNYKNDDNGFVSRNFRRDDRNSDGIPHYTSLIIDFISKKK
ncbi:MAG: hypothetical protein WCS69_14715 [Ignavibacteriaceae bacterium]|jgi:predicted SAM-dependent methyltransferase